MAASSPIEEERIDGSSLEENWSEENYKKQNGMDESPTEPNMMEESNNEENWVENTHQEETSMEEIGEENPMPETGMEANHMGECSNDASRKDSSNLEANYVKVTAKVKPTFVEIPDIGVFEYAKKAEELGPLSRRRLPNGPVAETLEVNPPPNAPQSATCFNNQLQYIQEKVLPAICRKECSLGFTEPVDPIKEGIPDYSDVIKFPMDLTSIRERLHYGYYLTTEQCLNDFKLMIANCLLYYSVDSEPFTDAQDLFKAIYVKLLQMPAYENAELKTQGSNGDLDVDENVICGDKFTISNKEKDRITVVNRTQKANVGFVKPVSGEARKKIRKREFFRKSKENENAQEISKKMLMASEKALRRRIERKVCPLQRQRETPRQQRRRERETSRQQRRRKREASRLQRRREREVARLQKRSEREASRLQRRREREIARLQRRNEREASRLQRRIERKSVPLQMRSEREVSPTL